MDFITRKLTDVNKLIKAENSTPNIQNVVVKCVVDKSTPFGERAPGQIVYQTDKDGNVCVDKWGIDFSEYCHRTVLKEDLGNTLKEFAKEDLDGYSYGIVCVDELVEGKGGGGHMVAYLSTEEDYRLFNLQEYNPKQKECNRRTGICSNLKDTFKCFIGLDNENPPMHGPNFSIAPMKERDCFLSFCEDHGLFKPSLDVSLENEQTLKLEH